MNSITQDELNSTIWRACDTFRGVIDPSDYKNYILTMLFLKYLSDVDKERRAELEERYGGNVEMIERQMSRERFVLPDQSDFDYLYKNRDRPNVGELIDIALEQIEDANRQKLEGVFRKISFNSDNLGETKDRNRRLKNLLEDFSGLDVRPSRVGLEVLGNAYMYLIKNFASGAGKKGGEFYTPEMVSKLLGKLLNPYAGSRICDPACGSGSLLLEVAHEIKGEHNYSLYGQEVNGGTWALCKMNMFLHREDDAKIAWGDTLNNPLLIEGDQLIRFDVVVANPPFSLDKWGQELAGADRFKRYWRGLPPKSKADYAFITHMVETAKPREGRVGVIVPHGVLFRGGAEGTIRRKLIEENVLDAVIGLPENLFFGTAIPAAILVFDRSREPGGENGGRTDVLFIDASREFQPGKNQNFLREADLDKIAGAFHSREEIAKYSRCVPVAEIAENDFNLNIPRYVDTFEEPEPVDLKALQEEIDDLETQLAAVRAKLTEHMRELEVI
jgi:type I restriction enzyme M protein